MKITDKKLEATFFTPQLPTSPSRLQVHRGHTLPTHCFVPCGTFCHCYCSNFSEEGSSPGKWVKKTKAVTLSPLSPLSEHGRKDLCDRPLKISSSFILNLESRTLHVSPPLHFFNFSWSLINKSLLIKCVMLLKVSSYGLNV